MSNASATASLVGSPRARGGVALLIVDMISCWTFPDADKLLPNAQTIARPVAALKTRCRRDGVPVIYANDNQGQWRSDFRELIAKARETDGPGALITELLHPDTNDYFVLKPKHSAFFCTPLELLLHSLRVDTLWIAGVATDQCVLVTAEEGRMRNLETVVPRDCVATQTSERQRRALDHFNEVMNVKTTVSTHLRTSGAR